MTTATERDVAEGVLEEVETCGEKSVERVPEKTLEFIVRTAVNETLKAVRADPRILCETATEETKQGKRPQLWWPTMNECKNELLAMDPKEREDTLKRASNALLRNLELHGVPGASKEERRRQAESWAASERIPVPPEIGRRSNSGGSK